MSQLLFSPVLTVPAFCLLSSGRSLKLSAKLKINMTLWVPMSVTTAGLTWSTQDTCPGKRWRASMHAAASGCEVSEFSCELTSAPSSTSWDVSKMTNHVWAVAPFKRSDGVQLALELLRAFALGEVDLFWGPWLAIFRNSDDCSSFSVKVIGPGRVGIDYVSTLTVLWPAEATTKLMWVYES